MRKNASSLVSRVSLGLRLGMDDDVKGFGVRGGLEVLFCLVFRVLLGSASFWNGLSV